MLKAQLKPVAMLALALAVSLTGLGVIPPAATPPLEAASAAGAADAPATDYSEEDIYWLARIISSEAKGEPFEGQVAVGAVVLNRVASPRFPNTVRGVTFQRGQFEPVMNRTIYREPAESAVRAAHAAASGWDPSGGALYFFNPRKSPHPFMMRRPVATIIGAHRFAH